MASERVSVFDVLGDVDDVELAPATVVGLQEHVPVAGVNVNDGSESAVVDVPGAVVAAGDYTVAWRVLAPADNDSSRRHGSVVLETLAGRLVEQLTRLVVAGDHHRVGIAVRAACDVPLIGDRVDSLLLGGMDVDRVALVRDVGFGPAVV